MFTGIIEEVGSVTDIQRSGNKSFVRIKANIILEDIKLGDSIAVNGVCLTVTNYDSTSFQADVMNETLNRSSLGSLRRGSPVDLERAMAAGGRFGGHIVSGHIDGTGSIIEIKNDGIAVWLSISAKQEILRYIVEKGSVTLDGISLTVAKVLDNSFSVSIIPHTASQTVLGTKKVGDIVNIENDIIAKYVEKLLKPGSTKEEVSMELLAKNGFV